MKLFVGNLPYSTTDSELADLFAPHGAVRSAKVIMDRETGRSRGFGFVEMEDAGDARKAMDALNGVSMGNRNLVVNEAKETRPMGGPRR